MLNIKTTVDKFAKMTLKVKEIHPYECPEVIACTVKCGGALDRDPKIKSTQHKSAEGEAAVCDNEDEPSGKYKPGWLDRYKAGEEQDEPPDPAYHTPLWLKE